MKKLEKNIKLISVLNFFTDFVFFAPVAVIYFSKVTGSYALGMSIFSVAYVSAAIFEVPTGVVSDIVGRKITTILGAASSVICVILYALAGSYWALFVGALFLGLARAFYSGNNDALLYDTLVKLKKEKTYHSYLGKTSSMFQVALAIASAMGGFLASKSFGLVMWLSVFPQIGALITSTLITDPGEGIQKGKSNIYLHLRNSLVQFRKNYRLRLLSLSSVIRFSFGESAFFLQSAFINSFWPLWAVGISYTLSFAGGAASFWFSGKVINRYKPLGVLNFSVVFNRAVGLFSLALRNVFSPALMSLSSVTFGLSSVAENTLLQKEFTSSQRATMSSINSFMGNVAFGVSSLMLGIVADNFGVVNALILVQVVLLTPLILYKKVFAYNKRGVI